MFNTLSTATPHKHERRGTPSAKEEQLVQCLKEQIEELKSTNGQKDLTIGKATKLIEILKKDLDRVINELQAKDSQLTEQQGRLKELEKENTAIQRELHQMQQIEKKQVRTSQLNSRLKGELEVNAKEAGQKELEILGKYNELQNENASLKALLEKVEKQRALMKEELQEQSGKEQHSSKMLGQLQTQLSSKDRQIEEQYQQFDKINADLQTQIAKVKNDLAVNLRGMVDKNLHSSDPMSLQEANQLGVSFFQEKIGQLVSLYQKDKKMLLESVTMESQKLKKQAEELSESRLQLRPELERWIMRNEELEQRVYQQSVSLVNMTIIIKDYQKALAITGKLDEELGTNTLRLDKANEKTQQNMSAYSQLNGEVQQGVQEQVMAVRGVVQHYLDRIAAIRQARQNHKAHLEEALRLGQEVRGVQDQQQLDNKVEAHQERQAQLQSYSQAELEQLLGQDESAIQEDQEVLDRIKQMVEQTLVQAKDSLVLHAQLQTQRDRMAEQEDKYREVIDLLDKTLLDLENAQNKLETQNRQIQDQQENNRVIEYEMGRQQDKVDNLLRTLEEKQRQIGGRDQQIENMQKKSQEQDKAHRDDLTALRREQDNRLVDLAQRHEKEKKDIQEVLSEQISTLSRDNKAIQVQQYQTKKMVKDLQRGHWTALKEQLEENHQEAELEEISQAVGDLMQRQMLEQEVDNLVAQVVNRLGLVLPQEKEKWVGMLGEVVEVVGSMQDKAKYLEWLQQSLGEQLSQNEENLRLEVGQVGHLSRGVQTILGATEELAQDVVVTHRLYLSALADNQEAQEQLVGHLAAVMQNLRRIQVVARQEEQHCAQGSTQEIYRRVVAFYSTQQQHQAKVEHMLKGPAFLQALGEPRALYKAMADSLSSDQHDFQGFLSGLSHKLAQLQPDYELPYLLEKFTQKAQNKALLLIEEHLRTVRSTLRALDVHALKQYGGALDSRALPKHIQGNNQVITRLMQDLPQVERLQLLLDFDLPRTQAHKKHLSLSELANLMKAMSSLSHDAAHFRPFLKESRPASLGRQLREMLLEMMGYKIGVNQVSGLIEVLAQQFKHERGGQQNGDSLDIV